MKVYLLRHGTRNFTVGDVPLNAEGLCEAEQLSTNKELLTVTTILSSPKKRAQMTVALLAKKLQKNIEIQDELDQFKSGETDFEFSNRVKSFLEKIESRHNDSPLIICSHSDWLSNATQQIASDAVDFKQHMFSCAEYIGFEIKDGLWLKT